jgi:hypothetical protein
MKYILLMSGTKEGVSEYQKWAQSDRESHMQNLGSIMKQLIESGEFVATQALSDPNDAKLVRGEKNGLPVTDGVFPESKEFLLGYWIVDVAGPQRALEIAGRLSAAPAREGIATNMPIEVRQFVERNPAA